MFLWVYIYIYIYIYMYIHPHTHTHTHMIAINAWPQWPFALSNVWIIVYRECCLFCILARVFIRKVRFFIIYENFLFGNTDFFHDSGVDRDKWALTFLGRRERGYFCCVWQSWQEGKENARHFLNQWSSLVCENIFTCFRCFFINVLFVEGAAGWGLSREMSNWNMTMRRCGGTPILDSYWKYDNM